MSTNAAALNSRETVPHLWDDHSSIFAYDRDNLRHYLERLERMQDNGGERNLAQIINIMEVKWQRMDRYWFQKHRCLDRKKRTKKDTTSYPGQAPIAGGQVLMQGPSQPPNAQGHPAISGQQ